MPVLRVGLLVVGWPIVAVLGTTWPSGALVPPFVRIDHVLTGARLAVTGIFARPGFGSDHRYIVATIAIRS